jgi:hypothetical protein
MKFLQNMKFKITPEFTFVIIAFMVVIVFANYGSCCSGPKPYELNNISPNFGKFEGFTDDAEESEDTDEDKEDAEEDKSDELLDELEDLSTKEQMSSLAKPFGLESFTGKIGTIKPAESFVTIGASVNDQMGGLTKPESKTDNKKDADTESKGMLDTVKEFAMSLFSSKPSDKETQESFSAMSPSSLDTAYDIVDQVGQLKANAECIGKSHGYTTSSGGVCWTKETEKLLLTRGGQQISKGEKL